LTRDSELKFTNGGQAIAHFSVATSDKVKDVETSSFWDCDLWGKQGEALSQYLTKGKEVTILGTVKQESWEKDGIKKSKVKVTVDHLSLGSGGGEKHTEQPPVATGGKAFEDDVPF
jgi:single-strand DNA-binding protein